MRKILSLLLCLLSLASCNKDASQQTNKNYEVGDLYSVGGVMGIVYKVDNTGKSGMIVSLHEPETLLAWSSELTTTNANNQTSGSLNMATIISLSDWQTKYPAFAWCQSLDKNWYLPSIEELKELAQVVNSSTFTESINKHGATPFATNARYLSSTEMDQFWVYLLDISTNTESANYKQYTYHIRAIRAF